MDSTEARTIVDVETNALRAAAAEVEKYSIELAKQNRTIAELKDELSLHEAHARVDVSTAINEVTGKPKYPNVDAQNAQVLVELSKSDKAKVLKEKLREAEFQRELTKAKQLRALEDRRDARSEADYMAAVLAT